MSGSSQRYMTSYAEISEHNNMLKKFHPSENKEIIRRMIDTPLIKDEFERKNRKLSYFGLPSDGLYDIIAWKNFLGSYDAVELGEEGHKSISQSLLMLCAFKNGISKDIRLLRGDINEIIISGTDDSKLNPRFPFDVVNLDYYGGMLHNGNKKVEAISRLVEKQTGSDFVLIMTFDVKEEDGGEKIKTLDKIEQRLLQLYPERREKIDKFVRWYQSDKASDIHRQKVYLPYFLQHPAEDKHFKIHFEEPVMYKGTKDAPMIHFVCKFTYEHDTTTASVSTQSILQILNLRIREVNDGKIIISSTQAPEI